MTPPNPFAQCTGRQFSEKSDTSSTRYSVGEYSRLVNKHEASAVLGISPETLKKYRLQANSTLIEGIHYHVWNARVVKYNAALIADWGLNRNNPEAHKRAIEAYLASLPSNQPKKRGRRAG
ncbi:MAG: hypothetical protein ACAF41_07565 [Leptolyngbya sp. BL-A-14]